jgi:type IV secretion system protein VirB4
MSGSTRALCPIEHFLPGQSVFRLRDGGYGQLFQVSGNDPDGQTPEQLASTAAQITTFYRQLDPSVTLCEYIVSLDGYPLSSESSLPPVIRRLAHIESTAKLRTVLYLWALYARRAAFEPIEQALSRLEDASSRVVSQLAAALGITPATDEETAAFYSFLLTLQRHERLTLSSPYRISRQIAHQGIRWIEPGTKIGTHYQLHFSLSKLPSGTWPDLFHGLRSVPGNIALCSSWTRKATHETMGRVDRIEGVIATFKRRFLERIVYAAGKREMERNARTVAAEKGTDHLGAVIDDLNTHSYGKYSLTGFLFGEDPRALRSGAIALQRAVGDPGQAAIQIEEPFSALSVYRTTLGFQTNVRQWWLRDDHAARLAFAWKPGIGRKRSVALRSEYLLVFPTPEGQPFFYDPYTPEGLRGLLIIGPPRQGKTLLANMIADHEAKYGGFTTIYDKGGAYEATVRSHAGLTTRIGLDGPRFAPWALPPSKESVHAIWLLVRTLLRKSGCQLSVTDEEELRKTIDALYSLPPESRRLSSLILPPNQMQYLVKWTGSGVYANMFDNTEDDLDLSNMQSFDFQGIEKHPDLLEPVIAWISLRKALQLSDSRLLHLPKHDIYDELWKHLQDPQMWQMLLEGLKTSGKRLGGVTLVTHHVDDLGEHAQLIKNAIPHWMFLPTPGLDRKLYGEFFDLNETELDIIATLPAWHVALKTPETFKVLQPIPDPYALAKYSTSNWDVQRREVLTLEYGHDEALERMAAEVKGAK